MRPMHPILSILDGSSHPRHMALGVFLGLVAGFVTGWNLTLAAVILLVAVLNVPAKVFGAFWTAGLALSWLLVAMTYRIGVVLLDRTPLGGLVSALGDGVLAALLDWDRYTLVGGAVVGLLIAIPASRAACRLAQDPGGEPASRPRLFRRRGWVAVPCGAVLAGGLAWWLGPTLMGQNLLCQLSAANEAEVSAAQMRLSLWTGDLVMEDVQFADPSHLDRDRLRIGRVTAQLQPGALLRGRLHMDKLVARHVRCDVGRRQPAAPAGQHVVRIEVPDGFLAASPAAGCELELDPYLRNWGAVGEHIGRLQRLIEATERLPGFEDAGARPGAGHALSLPAGASRLALHSELGRPQPRLFVGRLRVEDLSHAWGLGPKSLLEMTHLSSNPLLGGVPTRLEIIAPELAAEMHVDLNLHQPGQRHGILFRAYDVRLSELVDPNQTDRTLVIGGGRANLMGEGWCDQKRLDVVLHIEATHVEARFVTREPLAGLDPMLWDDGLRRLGGLRAEAVLAGHWTAPCLTLDTERLVNHFKHQLRAAGEHQLVAAVDERLAPGASLRFGPPAGEVAPDQQEIDTPPPGFYAIAQDSDAEVPAELASDEAQRQPALEEAPQEHGLAPAQWPYESGPPDAVEMITHERPTPAGPDPAARRYPQTDAPWPMEALPGPIDLVVGHGPQDTSFEAAEDGWPSDPAAAEAALPEQAPPVNLASRWFGGLAGKVRGLLPRRRPPTVPPPPDMPLFGTPANQLAPAEDPLGDAGHPRRPPRDPWYKRIWR